jgi:DnaK suppressor protein
MPLAHLRGMTTTDLTRFRGILQEARRAVEESLRRREGVAVERTPDSSDEAQYAFDQDLKVRTLDQDSMTLAAIKAAMNRMAEGVYGECENCGAAIHVRRLLAIPWTSYCLHCQEECDQGRKNGSRSNFGLAA